MSDRQEEFEDTKEIIRMSDRQEEFEDTKQVIRIRRSKKGRQHNGQRKKDKQQSTKHAHKPKVRVTIVKTEASSAHPYRIYTRLLPLITSIKGGGV